VYILVLLATGLYTVMYNYIYMLYTIGLGEECTRDEYGNSVSNHSNDLLSVDEG